MPHPPNDARHPHLPLLRVEANPDRRKRPGFSGPRPDRGGRTKFSSQLLASIATIETEAQKQLTVPGFAPHLVFKIPLETGAAAATIGEQLADAGLTLVAIEPDNAIVVFRDDKDLADFKKAVALYRAGPRIIQATGELAKTTKWDMLEFFDTGRMHVWSRADRIGSRLRKAIGQEGLGFDVNHLYHVDVELWHPGDSAQARRHVDELRTFIREEAKPNERLCDDFIGDLMLLARVAVYGAKLSRLLDLSIVSEVELPEQPTFDAQTANRTTARDFPRPATPPPGGPKVCILDSGISANHPLLAPNVGHEEAILTNVTSPADGNGHGTRVAGVAVFGDIRACYANGSFSSPVQLFSARVLNDHNRFDDEQLVVNQMSQAIDTFVRNPHNCRVFNLSLGSPGPALISGNARQSTWAEALDFLARRHKVLVVVSAGNNHDVHAETPKDAERVLATFPKYLFEPQNGICDPASAAIALTVGSLAAADTPAIKRGVGAQDIWRPVAKRGQPSPFSRTGPGLGEAIKPELVGLGGNLLFEGFGSSVRRVRADNPDAGVSVMSLSHEPTKSLFSFGIGTSYAAPQIARLASMTLNRLQAQLRADVDPNLVRAVLANAASVPSATSELLKAKAPGENPLRVTGYGLPDEELALTSSDRWVLMVAQGKIQLDTLQLFEVPIPNEFRTAPGKKRITVSLAFDPPVRRRRAQYLGVEMGMYLFRGKSPDEIIAAYRSVTKAERPGAPGAIQGSNKCKLEPSAEVVESSTLQRREWAFSRESSGYGDTYYLMIQARRNWAPTEITEQDFGLAVSLAADEPKLYNLIRQRIQVRTRARVRS